MPMAAGGGGEELPAACPPCASSSTGGGLTSPPLLAPKEREPLLPPHSQLGLRCGWRWCAQVRRSVRPNSCRVAG